jgi:hypothetical protein
MFLRKKLPSSSRSFVHKAPENPPVLQTIFLLFSGLTTFRLAQKHRYSHIMDNMFNNHAAQSYWSNLLPQDFEPEPLVASQPTFQKPTMACQAHFESAGADDLLTRRLLPFPHRLHRMLQDVENRDKQHIVSWTSSGRSFKVHKPAQFVKEVAPTYFNLAQYKSFKRQLLNYGFVRVANSQDDGKGTCFHSTIVSDESSLTHFFLFQLLVHFIIPISVGMLQANAVLSCEAAPTPSPSLQLRVVRSAAQRIVRLPRMTKPNGLPSHVNKCRQCRVL